MLDINKLIYQGRFRLLLLCAFLLISIFAFMDIIADIHEGTERYHIIIEAFVFLIAISAALGMSLHLLKEARMTRELVTHMQGEVDRQRQQAEQWQKETRSLLRGLSVSINNQFDRWQLTQTEKEVALFLLKGFSHKDVALLRDVSEATARQQARAVYRKAGVTGRNELAAFFLEELALPVDEHARE
ncbi:MAG: LuxR C-terminal-related transcriptional regulator [Gammaproteobacteria bacterium]